MSAHEKISKAVSENDVLLYMKGTPVFRNVAFLQLLFKYSIMSALIMKASMY